MSKFKIGETVYLKGKIQDYDGLLATYRIDLCGERLIFREDDELYTKEEILEILNKPDVPKLGEVFMAKTDQEKATVVYVKGNQVVLDFGKDLFIPHSDDFWDEFERVES